MRNYKSYSSHEKCSLKTGENLVKCQPNPPLPLRKASYGFSEANSGILAHRIQRQNPQKFNVHMVTGNTSHYQLDEVHSLSQKMFLNPIIRTLFRKCSFPIISTLLFSLQLISLLMVIMQALVILQLRSYQCVIGPINTSIPGL